MSATRRLYEEIAREIAWHYAEVTETKSERAVLDSLVEGLATILETDDPRFDRARFVAAAGAHEMRR